MAIDADDVRQLLAHQDADAALILLEGRIEVKTPAELASPNYRGALQIVTRAELQERAGGVDFADRELAELAADLDTAVQNMGG